LSLEWSAEEGSATAVAPSEVVRTLLYVRNEGGSPLESVTLRFDQHEAGRLPFGISVGTATNVSSRLEGEAQVWDLGRIRAGESVLFAMTLWFDATSRTAEPLPVGLLMVAESPTLEGTVRSNLLEVTVDARQAAGR
jgi:hypothetical protein